MIRVLYKAIVARFYERNTGFFLVIFYLMFGIVESSQIVSYHKSLMNGMITAPVFLAVVMGLWLLYWLKCIAFFSSRLDLAENEILFRLNVADTARQQRLIALVVTVTGAPVLLYSVLVIVMALSQAQYLSAAEIAAFHALAIFFGSRIIRRKINSPHISTWRLPLPKLRWTRPRPFAFFYVNHLTRQLATVLWVSKVISILCIVGFLQLPTDGYDNRTALLGFLFGLTAHAVIVFEFRRFEDQYLTFTRNLPLSIGARLSTLITVYSLLLAPELILLVVNKLYVVDITGIAFLGLGFLLTLHTALYSGMLNMERHTTRTLALFLVSFMLVLWKAYLPEALVLWAVAAFWFNRNFYEFEGAKG